MSASRVAADTCPNCAARLPRPRGSARLRRAGRPGSTVQEQVPPNETGQVPVAMQRSEPHWFGVAPPQLLLALAVVAFVSRVVLFAIGHWPYGLILLGAAALLLAAFLEAACRRPGFESTRTSVDARERARSSWQTLRVRQAAAAEVRRMQNALLLLDSDRRTALQELGAAAPRGRHGRRGARRAHARGARCSRDAAAGRARRGAGRCRRADPQGAAPDPGDPLVPRDDPGH